MTEEILHATFIPFGDIKSVQIPREYVESKYVYDITIVTITNDFYAII